MWKNIKSEFRRNWKSKNIFVLLFAFLCFFAVTYNGNIDAMNIEYREDLIRMKQEGGPIAHRNSLLQDEFEKTWMNPREGMIEEKELWEQLYENYVDFNQTKYNLSFFDWEDTSIAAYNFYSAFLEGKQNGVYKGELDFMSGYSEKELETQIKYYEYLNEHNIKPYFLPSEPTIVNFLVQLMNRDSMFLFLAIASFFLIFQSTNEFENGTYKQIYSSSVPRFKVMTSKIISNYIMFFGTFIIALAIFSVVPISNYGIGSFNYLYIINGTHLVHCMTLLLKSFSILFLLVFVYLLLSYFLSLVFKEFSTTLIASGAIMVLIYFAVRLFGNSIFFAWIPFFYLDVVDIASGNFPILFALCIVLLVVFIIGMFVFDAYYINKMDMNGSDSR